MQKNKIIELKPAYYPLGSNAELVIWNNSVDGGTWSISIEDWQLEAIQRILGLNWTDTGHQEFSRESVYRLLKKAGVLNLQKIVNSEEI